MQVVYTAIALLLYRKQPTRRIFKAVELRVSASHGVDDIRPKIPIPLLFL